MQVSYHLLIRYLTGESTDIEQYQVEQWLEAKPEHRRLMEEVELIWDTSAKNLEAFDNGFDAETDWKALQYRIEKELNKKRKMVQPGKADKTYLRSWTGKNSGFVQVMRIAAVLLVAALVGVYAWQNFHVIDPGQEESVMREIVMDKGQRANMVLSDGTIVNLNADSKINIPETFHSDKREVFLHEGEAYFDVTGDPDRPFLIHSGGAVVRVLGTSFAVRAYPEDETVRVVVNEGTVSLAPSHNEDLGIALTAGQLGHFNINNNNVDSGEVEDMKLFLSWIEGYLKFKDTSMKEVAVQLERRYNIEVGFSDPTLEELRLTAVLKGRNITNVLNVITASLEIGYYKTDHQKIVFTDPQKIAN